MKGLRQMPSAENFRLGYGHLQHKREPVSSISLALYSQWGRFDPRFAEVLVAYLFEHWQAFSPLEMNQELLKVPWPQAFGVYVEHVRQLIKLRKVGRQELECFKAWSTLCLKGIEPTSTQLFFIGIEKIGGHRVQGAYERSTRAYAKWGYLSQEILFNKHRAVQSTQISKDRRQKTIEKLISAGKPFSVEDYRSALNWGISQRTAQRDLAYEPRLSSRGHTRKKQYFDAQ
jgi:hypothetical protein